ncbi:hypothetical protein BV898_03044 [Hypsibius exemplaris]|uniref:Uncharacterized protein n=1 Tax=Hypsibius exemplaris TaxID=2072580 RepID=A0A1W0X682_HYPEX|nr:hypothetical protein BV898_03044 [Hypsibius exemplaris]
MVLCSPALTATVLVSVVVSAMCHVAMVFHTITSQTSGYPRSNGIKVIPKSPFSFFCRVPDQAVIQGGVAIIAACWSGLAAAEPVVTILVDLATASACVGSHTFAPRRSAMAMRNRSSSSRVDTLRLGIAFHHLSDSGRRMASSRALPLTFEVAINSRSPISTIGVS